MDEAHEELFDKRVVKRNIEDGHVTAEEYEAWLESLEDCADNVSESDIRFVHTVGRGDG